MIFVEKAISWWPQARISTLYMINEGEEGGGLDSPGI
jgi:hypothetical protein